MSHKLNVIVLAFSRFNVVDLLILSVGRVEDDTDVIPVRAAPCGANGLFRWTKLEK
jgi:hypothetical protein